MFKNKKVVVIATHSDDETLGAGGTLLKHKFFNDELYCVFCTSMYEDDGYSIEIIKRRDKEIQEVCKAYGFKEYFNLNLKTTKVDEYPKGYIIKLISDIFLKIKPNIVYLPFAYDVHSDHRIIFDSAYSCTKSFRYPSIERILMMETLSETEFTPSLSNQVFIPNVFVDISDFFEEKCNILKIYESELGNFPFPRSLENLKALANFRAATMGGGNVKFAESFMLLKERI